MVFSKDKMLLLLLSRFSRVWLCATPYTAAHQASLSLGFSRQEHWSGLPFPSPMHKSESEVTQPCPTPSNPMDCSPPGSSVHGIFQARVLEWAAIAFSNLSGYVFLFFFFWVILVMFLILVFTRSVLVYRNAVNFCLSLLCPLYWTHLLVIRDFVCFLRLLT